MEAIGHEAETALLNSLTSLDAQRGYRHAIDEFVDWYCSEPRVAFNSGCGRIADKPGATREASSPSSIHIELELANLHRSELNFLP
jgi:hypothetical protein